MSSEKITSELIEQYNKMHVEKKNYIIHSIEESNWVLQKQEENIKLYFRSIDGSKFIETKTVVNVKAPAQCMVDIMTTGKVYKLEDTPQGPIPPREIYMIYDAHDENQSYIYFMAMESPFFMVTPREFMLYRRTYFENGKTIFVQMSIDNEDIKPQRKEYVRGFISEQRFVIEEDTEDKNQCILTVFSHVNPGGSLPSWAVNYSVKNQLDGIKYITNEVVKYYKQNH